MGGLDKAILAYACRLQRRNDALMDAVRGKCRYCKHGKEWNIAIQGSAARMCVHLGERVVAATAKRGCDHFEFKWPEGVEGED